MMSDRFDKLIRDSAPEMPDPGEYRRMNRVALRDRLHQMEQPRGRRSLVVATAFLALMVLFGGQVSNLGSNGFDNNILVGTDGRGNEIPIYEDKFTGSTLQGLDSEEATKELLQQKAAGEGILDIVTCLSYGGKSDWKFNYIHIVNGEKFGSNTIYNPPGYPSANLPNFEFFIRTHYADLIGFTRTSPPIKEYTEEIEGTVLLMRTWQKSYPGFGMVTHTRGIPVE